LADYLKKGMPPSPTECMTKHMQKNVVDYEAAVQDGVRNGTIPRGTKVDTDSKSDMGRSGKVKSWFTIRPYRPEVNDRRGLRGPLS
jgi:hypothetical protein